MDNDNRSAETYEVIDAPHNMGCIFAVYRLNHYIDFVFTCVRIFEGGGSYVQLF